MTGSGVPAPHRSGGGTWREFAATPASVPDAHHWVRDRLARIGVEPDVRALVELLVSELATNAVRHTRGARLLVSLLADERDGGVEAAVRDDDAAPPRPRRAEPWEPDGRGLALVAALSDS